MSRSFLHTLKRSILLLLLLLLLHIEFGNWYSLAGDSECPNGTSVGYNGCAWQVHTHCIPTLSDITEIYLHFSSHVLTRIARALYLKTLERIKTISLECLQSHKFGLTCLKDKVAPFPDAQQIMLNALNYDDPSQGGCPDVPPPQSSSSSTMRRASINVVPNEQMPYLHWLDILSDVEHGQLPKL
jgi:hypothetical protein